MPELFDVEFVASGGCAHPDELTRRVMTTRPAAVDAGPRTATGGFCGVEKIPCLRTQLPDAGKRCPASLCLNSFRDGRGIAWVACARNVQTCLTIR
jgi:hypothetical protein